ncbi:MAG: hypothetical protein COX62_07975 [Deltaproteobacteria bacterium CG_4_10_14_0_2_um_filter_43_8]|nr:MAG: hypothetical protein COV43_03730 [Deltaproteobacteria bacterium CG11_big_fil_rev_8_21_14_0_20_42_23]PJA18841.1 MAG: hypothetical protein COX62_07975 [Deltaproteobacteria bacterium CG_4_10_14_0_2_um_filter_43_8]PJC64768.1 MAG: hypothetical protein CO021_02525 [Deltaproteobacteria bacterium CG_4_9_14_0_2_um_filter_42_21]
MKYTLRILFYSSLLFFFSLHLAPAANDTSSPKAGFSERLIDRKLSQFAQEVDVILDSALDKRGNLIVVGQTYSKAFPMKNALKSENYDGSVQAGGAFDGFIAKYSPEGELLFSSYLGGENLDEAIAVQVDSQNNVYVCGWTKSKQFLGENIEDEVNVPARSLRDIFLLTFHGTFEDVNVRRYGGINEDRCQSLVIDEEKRRIAVLATIDKATAAFPFIREESSYQPVAGGALEGVVLSLDLDSLEPLCSSFLGGAGNDTTGGAFFHKGSLYIAGTTFSDQFPQSEGIKSLGLSDVYMLQMNPEDCSSRQAFRFGGESFENLTSLAFDAEEEIVI